VTPLTASLWKPIQESVFAALLPVDERKQQPNAAWIRRLYGRLYLNEGKLCSELNLDPFLSTQPATPNPSGEEIIPETKSYQPGQLLIHGLRSLRNDRALETSISYLKSALAHMEDSLAQSTGQFDNHTSDAQIWSHLQHNLAQLAQVYQGQVAVESQIHLLRQDLQQVVPERALNELTHGAIPFTHYPKMEQDLAQLATQLSQSGLADLLPKESDKPLWPSLAEIPRAAPLLQKIKDFLDRYGHHTGSEQAQSRLARGEFEWLHPRWAEEPEHLLRDLLRLAAQGTHDHLDRIINPGNWAKVAQEGHAKLNLLQRIGFNRNMGQLEEMTTLSSQGRGYLLRLLLPIRQGMGLLGERWQGRGWLPAAEDIFFLLAEEVAGLVQAGEGRQTGQEIAALGQRIQARRAAWQFWNSYPGSPKVLDHEFNSIESLGYHGAQMRGIGVSPGWAEGRARIIVSPREFSAAEPDEILVTHSCEPEWTPLFSQVRGVVAEVGGPLSHSSIAAREMALPAVMGVTGALYRIRTGQYIRLDGSTGRVYLA
jgi:phosphohistidine swiveling domain-containing protein